MVCKNARSGRQNERKNPQTSAKLKKCSFGNINLGHLFIARAEIEDSGTNCVFEQKKSEQKKKVSMEGPGCWVYETFFAQLRQLAEIVDPFVPDGPF